MYDWMAYAVGKPDDNNHRNIDHVMLRRISAHHFKFYDQGEQTISDNALLYQGYTLTNLSTAEQTLANAGLNESRVARSILTARGII